MTTRQIEHISASAFLMCVFTFAACTRARVESPIEPIEDFGPNPGALVMYERPPVDPDVPHAVIIALHGCSQGADAMNKIGLVELADANNIGLIFPEQRLRNNVGRCFNWMLEEDARGDGESGSILAMLDDYERRHEVDPSRVYVVGLSAGAAMGSVLLVNAPRRFAAGALFAGGPFGCFGADASRCMSGGIERTADEWAALARQGRAQDRWPRVLAIHGADDRTVDPSSSANLTTQFTSLHHIEDPAILAEQDGVTSSRWSRGDEVLVESVLIEDLGHAVPIDLSSAIACGQGGAYREDVGWCGVRHALEFFGELDPAQPK